MPELDPERKAIANKIAQKIASENQLTAPQARAFVRGLQTSWKEPPIQWDEEESRIQYSDAMRLINAASILQSVDGRNSTEAQMCFRRSGELLEWLSRADDNIPTTFSLKILSAAAYQLGGSPAMAAALLHKVEYENAGERLYASFLRADFDNVISLVGEFWQNNLEISGRATQRSIIDDDDEGKIGWYITVDLVRALGLFADSIRRGNADRYNLAIRKLKALSNFANQTFSDDVSLFVALLDRIAEGFARASIYKPIRLLSELNVDWAPYLEEFARRQFDRGRGILWASQQQGIKRLTGEESFALCTPTGSGKTLVANLALVKELLLRADKGDNLALYIVPSRALANEVEAKLSDELSKDVIVTGLYGGTDWGVTSYWLDTDKPTVLIATVEKADALMRFLSPLILRRLRLLVLDEAHQVVPEDNDRTQDDFADHTSRSLRLEAFVSKLLTRAPNTVRIALTAVAGGAAHPVARWIEGKQDAEPVGSNFRSTRQIIGSFETKPGSKSRKGRPGSIRLEVLNDMPLSVRRRADFVYINLQIPPMPLLPPVMRNSIYRFNQLDVLWAALHLAEGGRRILISIAQRPEQTMGWFKDALEMDDWAGVPKFGFSRNENETNRFNDTRAACVDYCGENSYEVALLDSGIASNHGQMPQRIRRLMIDLISRGICLVTVATATLTEGVNLPFDMIFVPSLMRRSYNATERRQISNPMSVAEFRNLAGRAGRPGAGNGLEGITLIPIPVRPSSTAEGGRRSQRLQISRMNADWHKLRQSLLDEESEQLNVSSPLALLLNGIAKKARALLKLEGEDLLKWLEGVFLPEFNPNVGRASTDIADRLADSIDELDGVLLSALEEVQRFDDDELEGTAAEKAISSLWNNTFTIYASAQEKWMEAAFIRRGQSVLEKIYPDREERSRLYQYGFTPCVGRRFEKVVPDIVARLQDTLDYGSAKDTDRLAVFTELCGVIAKDRGFGFRIRPTEADRKILKNWKRVLSWWMHAPGHKSPEPQELRSWQRFVSDNIEFRLGLGLGAVVASAWSEGVDDALDVPSLDVWRQTTKLPWFGFWARELLRWGTLDPLVAFALAEGLVKTRKSGALLRPQYEAWLNEQVPDATSEDLIDPQQFLKWRQEHSSKHKRKIRTRKLNATLRGTDGSRGQYPVIPVVSNGVVHWLDAAGFALAHSSVENSPFNYCDDFLLRTNRRQPIVTRTFKGLSIQFDR